jgi:hypothetical protein
MRYQMPESRTVPGPVFKDRGGDAPALLLLMDRSMSILPFTQFRSRPHEI